MCLARLSALSAQAHDPRDRGCETYVVREGYEGLVRGNSVSAPPAPAPARSSEAAQLADDAFVNNMRFGDGELLRSGEGDASDHPDGHTLKGRYIIRVGWDDVRGWLGEVRPAPRSHAKQLSYHRAAHLLAQLAARPSAHPRAV